MATSIYIVIPAKDEATRLAPVLQSLRQHGYKDIIVVDDGSSDQTANLAREYGCIVLQHLINLGSGAATQTGLEFASKQQADFILTMDADGQHVAEDIDHLVEEIQKGQWDVIIGSRFMNPTDGVPTSRRLFNRIASGVTWLITGVYVTDSQSGMKIMTGDFAKKVEFHFNGFEFCTELFHIIRRNKGRFKEIPIQAIYTQDSMQKGQNIWIGFRMLFRLLLWKR